MKSAGWARHALVAAWQEETRRRGGNADNWRNTGDMAVYSPDGLLLNGRSTISHGEQLLQQSVYE